MRLDMSQVDDASQPSKRIKISTGSEAIDLSTHESLGWSPVRIIRLTENSRKIGVGHLEEIRYEFLYGFNNYGPNFANGIYAGNFESLQGVDDKILYLYPSMNLY